MLKSEEKRYGIIKFNGLYFNSWKFIIEILLEVFSVLKCLTMDM